MGKLENSSRQKRRRKNIKSLVLTTVGTAGILSVALVAPNVLSAMAKLGIIPVKRQKEIVNQARNRLLKRGYLRRNKDGFLELTKRGKREFLLMQVQDKLKHGRWDKRWRLIIFDISEKRRHDRDLIRQTLINAGFMKLQNSVWVFPYDCEEFVALLKADFKIGRSVLYLIVEEIEGEKLLKKYFGLN